MKQSLKEKAQQKDKQKRVNTAYRYFLFKQVDVLADNDVRRLRVRQLVIFEGHAFI